MGETRSASSVLLIEEIDSTQDQTCFWCQIEFNGLILPDTSSSLCIESEDYYTGLLQADSCSESPHAGTMPVDTSIHCINISDKVAGQLELLKDDGRIQTSSSKPTATVSCTAQLIPTLHISDSVHPTTTKHVGSSGLVIPDSEAIVPLKTSINIDQYSLHTATPVAMSTSKTHASATPSSALDTAPVSTSVTQSPVQATMTSTTTTEVTMPVETVPKSSFEGALYAAIIVCVLFVGVIVVLVVVIVCLMRKKCSCLERSGQSLRQRVQNSNEGRYQPGKCMSECISLGLCALVNMHYSYCINTARCIQI